MALYGDIIRNGDMYSYSHRAFYGHTNATTDTITILSGNDAVYANQHGIIECWMAHNNGDNWAYSKYFVWINYQGTGTHAVKEIHSDAGSSANSAIVSWNGSTFLVSFYSSGGQNGYMSYNVLTSHKDAILLH